MGLWPSDGAGARTQKGRCWIVVPTSAKAAFLLASPSQHSQAHHRQALHFLSALCPVGFRERNEGGDGWNNGQNPKGKQGEWPSV